MSTSAAAAPLGRFQQLRFAREVLQSEGQALLGLAKRLDDEICDAVSLLFGCEGSVIVSGMGKAGLVGQKIAATLASTGTRSHYLHAAEALHGDLGRIHSDDVALILSQSGETAEVVGLLPSLIDLKVAIIAITGRRASALARAANVVIDLGPLVEACPLGLAPTTSTTAMLAVGDALALVVSRMRSFGREDFARFHPGGNLGQRLSRVEQHMRPLTECRVAAESAIARGVFIARRRVGRRSGAIMLVDERGKLSGIFTDSDLARLFENNRDAEFDGPIANLMTRSPKSIGAGALMADAVKLMAECKISELPVIDRQGLPVGMIDITDIVGLLPEEHLTQLRDSSPSIPLAAGDLTIVPFAGPVSETT